MSTLRELVQALYAAADDIHGEIDRQTYDEKRRGDFDLPDDYEYSVTITAAQERALSTAIVNMAKALQPMNKAEGDSLAERQHREQGCGYPYCGGNAPECLRCKNHRHIACQARVPRNPKTCNGPCFSAGKCLAGSPMMPTVLKAQG